MRVIKPDTLAFLYKRIGAEQGMVLSATILAAFTLDANAPDRVLPERALWPMVRKAMDRGEVFEWSLPKAEAEFLVYGACRVPAPVRAAQVRVSVGEKRKTLDVYGDRFWRGGRPGDPEPFTAMPVSWHRSYGGPDFPENPLGRGRAPEESGLVALPNILPEGVAPGAPDEVMRPAGFHAIRPDRPSRMRHFGKFDDKWLAERWPHYPSGTSFAFCLTAPEDQRMGRFFNGDEAISLTNMVPGKPELASRLPGLRARFFLLRRDGGAETARERPVRADTLWLFPDENAGVLAWRNLTLVPDDDLQSVPRCLLALERMAEPPRPEEEYLALLRGNQAKSAEGVIARPTKAAAPVPAAPKPAAPQPAPLPPEAEAALAELRATTAEIRSRAEAALAGSGIAPQAGEAETAAPPMASSINELIQIYAPPDEIDKKLLQRALDDATAKLAEQAGAILAKTGVRPEEIERLMAAEQDSGPAGLAPDLGRLGEASGPGREAPKEIQAHMDGVRTALADLAGAAGALAKEAESAAGKEKPGDKPAGPTLGAPKARPDIADVLARRASGRSLAGLDLRGLDFSGQALAGADFTGCRLEGAIFAKADLTGAVFDRAALTGADFSGALADGARFTDCLAEKAVFAGARLARADLARGEFGGADFSGAALGGAILDKASFAGACLCGAIGRGLQARKTDFSKANLAKADLADACLEEADLSRTVLSGADLRRVAGRRLRLEGATGEKVLLSGASLVNARADAATLLPGADLRRCDLSRAGFAEARLPGANCKRADLSGAMFAKADLTGANLRKVRARGARFDKAVLARASLYKADLFKASLRRTDLTAAVLVKASLHGADLYQCILREASRQGANLNRTALDPRIFRHGQ